MKNLNSCSDKTYKLKLVCLTYIWKPSNNMFFLILIQLFHCFFLLLQLNTFAHSFSASFSKQGLYISFIFLVSAVLYLFQIYNF